MDESGQTSRHRTEFVEQEFRSNQRDKISDLIVNRAGCRCNPYWNVFSLFYSFNKCTEWMCVWGYTRLCAFICVIIIRMFFFFNGTISTVFFFASNRFVPPNYFSFFLFFLCVSLFIMDLTMWRFWLSVSWLFDKSISSR